MTEATLAEVAAWLDEQAEDQEFFGGIGDCLRQRFGADGPLAPVVWAFDYMLLSMFDARNEDHGPFGPVFETTGGQHPPPLDKVPDEAMALWEKLSELVTHPFLRARLNDLMWERRWSGSPYLYAVTAIDAYLLLARSEADGIEHVDALARAAGLTREINDRQRGQLVVGAAFSRAEAELTGSEPAPGIVIGLLDVAIRIGGKGVRKRVADLLEQARGVFDDPWIQDSLIGQQLAVSSGEQNQHKRLQHQKVDTWLKGASTETGMRRRHFLMRALEYARTHGFRELAEQIRQEIQELGFDEGDLQRISTEVELPSEDVEDAISLISSAESWSGCLKRLLILGPLSGNLKDCIVFVRQQAQEFVFQQLAPIEVLGPWKETIYVARTEEDKERLNLSNYERLAIDMASHVVAIVLDEV